MRERTGNYTPIVLRTALILAAAAMITLACAFAATTDHPLLRGISVILLPLLLFSALMGLTATGEDGYRWVKMSLLALLTLAMIYSFSLEPSIAFPLTVTAVVLTIVMMFKSVWNSLLFGRMLHGGIYSGVVTGGIVFTIMAFVIMGLYRFLNSRSGMGSTYFSVIEAMALVLGTGPAQTYFFLLLLATIAFLNAGTVPRYLRVTRPLPRVPIRSPRRGVTLIELLIVIAILAISVPAFVYTVQAASRNIERSRDARMAVRVARNEIEAMRALEFLPDPGTHGFITASPLRGEVTIGESRPDGLIPVSIHIETGSEMTKDSLTFEVLLPARETAP